MRTVGTVARGIRCPIIRTGDNIPQVVAASVQEAWAEAGFEPRDKDVVAVTESVVARAQGNYASVAQIGADVRAKTGGETVGVIFPILSRNRFSLLLKGISVYKSSEIDRCLMPSRIEDTWKDSRYYTYPQPSPAVQPKSTDVQQPKNHEFSFRFD